jgi:hypothetical protein
VVGGVDAVQVEVVGHALPQCGKGLLVDLGHEQQGGAGVEGVTVQLQLADSASGYVVLFQDGDLAATPRQAGGGGDPANAGAHDHYLRLASVILHGSSLK